MFLQGDLQDILNLRKNLLKAVLGHLNWQVLNEIGYVHIPLIFIFYIRYILILGFFLLLVIILMSGSIIVY